MVDSPLLRIEDLAVSFHTDAGAVQATSEVNLAIYPRQTVALVGESGCGKSVSALSTLQLIPTPPGRYDTGRIRWYPPIDLPGHHGGSADGVDLLSLSDRQMQRVRGNSIAMIFQEPMTSLNPVYTIGDQILEAIQLHQHLPRAAALDTAERALRDVGIAEPRRRLDEYPHQLSGGMRQRVMIAMALACEPELLLADEPTTALDVTIQAQILELLRELQQTRGMSIMLITHDLGVVAENADVVAVMYAGRIVEYGSVTELFAHPMHPYTRGLFSSIPKLSDRRRRLITILDQQPDPSVLPDGFRFTPPDDAPRDPVPRYPILQTLDTDESNVMAAFLRDTATAGPKLYELKPEHWVACWRQADDQATEQLTRPDLAFRREPAASA